MSAYETIADHYGIPSVNMGLKVAEDFLAEQVTIRGDSVEGRGTFSKDGVRPTDTGNKLYLDALTEAFARIARESAPTTHAVPPPYTPGNHERACLVPLSPGILSGEWGPVPETDELWGRCRRHFDSLWHTNTPGASITFRFRGTAASLFHLMGPDTGRVRVEVDGVDRGVKSHVDKWCYFHRLSGLGLVSGLEDGEHTVTVELLPGPPDRGGPIAEAKRLERHKPEAFEGVTLYVGAIRLLGEPL